MFVRRKVPLNLIKIVSPDDVFPNLQIIFSSAVPGEVSYKNFARFRWNFKSNIVHQSRL